MPLLYCRYIAKRLQNREYRMNSPSVALYSNRLLPFDCLTSYFSLSRGFDAVYHIA